MRVPGFLVRQFAVPGSLRNTSAGFSVEARNPLADGVLVGIGRISVDGAAIAPAAITATRIGDQTRYRATDVSPRAPVAFRKGDVVTFHVEGPPLAPGQHRLEVEIIERDLGSLSLEFADQLTVD